MGKRIITKLRFCKGILLSQLLFFSGTSYGVGLGLGVEGNAFGISVKEKRSGETLQGSVLLLKSSEPGSTDKSFLITGGMTKHYKKYFYYGGGLGTRLEMKNNEMEPFIDGESEGFDPLKFLGKFDARAYAGARYIIKRQFEVYGEFIMMTKLDLEFNDFPSEIAFGIRYSI